MPQCFSTSLDIAIAFGAFICLMGGVMIGWRGAILACGLNRYEDGFADGRRTNLPPPTGHFPQ